MLSAALDWLRHSVPAAVPPAPDEPEAVRRARSVVGQGRYRLGKGGRRPRDPVPFDRDGFADCSGFASWAMGLDRFQPGSIGGGWISTDSIVRDAQGPRFLFDLVPIGDVVRPGDVIVYPGRFVAGRRVAIGHVGLVVAVPPGWRYEAAASLKALRIIHCAASGPVAVRESDGGPWRRRGIVARKR